MNKLDINGFTYIRNVEQGLNVKEYRGTKKVINIQDVAGEHITAIKKGCFTESTSVKTIVLDESVTVIENYAFDVKSEIVIYTPLLEEDLEIDLSKNWNLVIRYGLEGLRHIDDVYYAYFKDGIATIYDNSIMRKLEDNYGRFGESIVLMSELEGCKVEIIESFSMAAVYNLERIILPEFLKVINAHGFYNCTMLLDIQTGDYLEYIGSNCFSENFKLREVIIGTGIKHIESNVFENSTKVVVLMKPNNDCIFGENWNNHQPFYKDFIDEICIEDIEYGLYDNNQAVVIKGEFDRPTDIVINEYIRYKGQEYYVTEIANYAFEDQVFLNSIVLHDHIRKIGTAALKHTSIKEVTLPKELKEISESLFEDCYQLHTCIMHNGVKSIKNAAFRYDEDLQDLILSDAIVEICDDAFMYTGIKKLILSDSLNRIGDGALLGSKIETIVIPRKVMHLPSFLLGDISTLKRIVLLNQNITLDRHLITTFNDIEVYYKGNENINLENQFRNMEYDTFTFHHGVSEIASYDNERYIEFTDSETKSVQIGVIK